MLEAAFRIFARSSTQILMKDECETQAVCLLYNPSYMAFMLTMTDSNDGFIFPHRPPISFSVVQSTHCTFSFRKFYLARLLLYKY
jgi:hypothetical protein